MMSGSTCLVNHKRDVQSYYPLPDARFEPAYQEHSYNFPSPQEGGDEPPAYTEIYGNAASSMEQQQSTHVVSTCPHGRSPSQAVMLSGYSSADSAGDDVYAEVQAPVNRHRPSRTPLYRLEKPVVIPQSAPGLGVPFVRAYSPALEGCGITEKAFLEFLDGLNVVTAGSPPLQVLDAGAGFVGMIPLHHTQLIAGGLQVAAKAGKAAVSKTRGSMYLKKASAELFAPCELKMELVTTDALRSRLGITPGLPLIAPLEISGRMSVYERRIAGLQGSVSPITFDVITPNGPTNALDRLSATAQKHALAKQQRKTMEAREKAYRERAKDSAKHDTRENDLQCRVQQLEQDKRHEVLKAEKKSEELQSKGGSHARRDLERLNRDLEKKRAKIEESLRKTEGEIDALKHDGRKNHKGKDHEAKDGEKILWIFIDNLWM